MASKMAQSAQKTCEICKRAPGLHYCTQCDQVFCDDCKMFHLRSEISRNHTFMTGPNIKTEQKAGGCKDHNEDFVYICGDCDQLICRICVTMAHHKHSLVNIKVSNNKLKNKISKYLDSKVDNIRPNAKLIEEKEKTYKTEVEATVKGIIEQGNIIKAMVDENVDALIKALGERERIELQSLSKASKDCTDLLEEVTRHQQIYQDMIKQCDEVALFHKMKKIKLDINKLKTVDVTNLPSATYNRKSVDFSDVEKLFGNLTFRETEVTVKETPLTVERFDQLNQLRQAREKCKSPISSALLLLTEAQSQTAPAPLTKAEQNEQLSRLREQLQQLLREQNEKHEQQQQLLREQNEQTSRLREQHEKHEQRLLKRVEELEELKKKHDGEA